MLKHFRNQLAILLFPALCFAQNPQPFNSGYTGSSGESLDNVFDNVTVFGGGASCAPTGFILSDGSDLGSRYANISRAGASPLAPATGFKNSLGQDLNTLCAKISGVPPPAYTVSLSGVNVTPQSQLVNWGQNASLPVTSSYPVCADVTALASTTCPGGSWAGVGFNFLAGPITANCSAVFTTVLKTVTVTSITPGTGTFTVVNTVTINCGSSAITIPVSLLAGYTTPITAVSADCPVGSWVGQDYTIPPFTANCSVTFVATPQYAITATATGVTLPTSSWTVGPNASVTIQADILLPYILPIVVGGTCPTAGGTWAGNMYTTPLLNMNCNVTFTGSP